MITVSGNMNNFWLGTFSGFLSALILFIVAMFVFTDKVNTLEQRQLVLEEVQAEQDKWIEDNKSVMQTYKFFNESWEAILDYDKRTKTCD